MASQLFSNGYALLIGIGDDLPVTVKDATALRNVLIDPHCAAYPSGQVVLLTEVSATRQQILAGFDQLIEQVKQNPRATVIIYYSGHGGYVKSTNEYFLVPHGYNPKQSPDTAISGLEFTQKIEAIQAQKLVVLLDCCHAGGVPALKETETAFVKSPAPQELLNVLGSGTGRVIIASSREDELSWTGNPYSVFTACLLEALRGKGAVNKDGYARILDALIYIFNEVPKRTSRSQHPFVKKVLDLGDNFPLCYYAGGSKVLPGETSTPDPMLMPIALTNGQRLRQEQRRDTLQSEWNLRSEKIKRMRADSAIATRTADKFELEQQLLEEESKLFHLEVDLNSIEQMLSSF